MSSAWITVHQVSFALLPKTKKRARMHKKVNFAKVVVETVICSFLKVRETGEGRGCFQLKVPLVP